MRNWHAVNQAKLFSKPLLHSLVPIAERRGIGAATLLKKTSIDLSLWSTQSNHRISVSDWFTVIQNTRQHLNDTEIWPLVAESIFQQRLSPIAELALQAPNLLCVLKQLQRYRHLIQPLEFAASRWHGSFLEIYLLPSFGSLNSTSYLSLSLLITIAQRRKLSLNEWQLRLPTTMTSTPQWSRWFSQVQHGAFLCVRIPRKQLYEVSESDIEQYRQAQAFCRIQHAGAITPSAVSHAQLWCYRQLRCQNEFSIGDLAAHLNISISSCKRLLKQHGSSFQHCVDTMRLFRMVELLQVQPFNNSQLATYLGYSNSNNLRRACKRWLGENPDRLRQILT